MADSNEMTVEERWNDLELLREHYPRFREFLFDVIVHLLHFNCSWLQLDIANYLSNGDPRKMVQSQRGEGKTTIAAAYAVWCIIHDPTTRVLIISSGDKMAKEISNWCIQIISGLEELRCLRPDRSAGDRASVEAYDVHYSLKGPEKSPSIACVGITSNLQGKRADILIADDVESTKNSQTDTQRERLRHLTLDFTSICSNGEILWLGTPQSIDSIYNGLPSRGYSIRIWPGRFPTDKEEENYGEYLAPSIVEKMRIDPSLRIGGGPTGDRGKVTDDALLNEETLTKKEVDQGPSYFQLQHMLDTRLADADRFPLKSGGLVFMRIGAQSTPLTINWVASEAHKIHAPQGFPLKEPYYRAAGFSSEFGTFQDTHMYVDPAGGGQNGDETAYAVTRFLAGKVYLVACGGVPGGLTDTSLDALTAIAVKWKPSKIGIEENYGKGALSSVWTPKLLKVHKCAIEDDWVSGQKELRIIDVLEPLIGSQRLIVEEELLASDWAACQHYPAEKRSSFSLFFQLARITRARNSLAHEDRLDAVAGSCRHWIDHLKQDEDLAKSRAANENYKNMVSNPLGNGRSIPGKSNLHSGLGPNAFAGIIHRR